MTVTLRRTQKLARALPITTEAPRPPDTALGDWYANRLVVDRRPLVLLVSAVTLFPMLIPGRDIASLPERLPDLVGQRLRRAGISSRHVAAEIAAMNPVQVAKTADRSVVGILVDFAGAAALYLPIRGWDETTLPFVEARLAETPCFASRSTARTVHPDRDTPRALAARWGAG